MECFEVDNEQLAKRTVEMIDFFKSNEGKAKIAEIAQKLPDIAKVDYLSLINNN
jgi:hypothetical protein